jgi:hypothetical protein
MSIAASGRRNYFLPEAALSKLTSALKVRLPESRRLVKHFRQNESFFLYYKEHETLNSSKDPKDAF